MRSAALVWVAAWWGLSCAPRAKPPVGPTVAATTAPSWRTLQAEHQVAIDVQLEDGSHDRRKLRGVIAVERPDRFRLRALGPGGITLFDVLYRGGEVTVLEAIRDPQASALAGVIRSMAGDLSAAFQLAPQPPGRTVRSTGEALIIEEPERTVRLSAWQRIGTHPVPTRITIDHRVRRYTVQVEAAGITLDSALDPALFKE